MAHNSGSRQQNWRRLLKLFVYFVPRATPRKFSYKGDGIHIYKYTEQRNIQAETIQNAGFIIAKINNAARSVIHGLKGDFSELSQSKRNDVNLLKAQEEFRKLNRKKANAANQAVSSIVDVLRRLDPKKRELFTRYRILQDLMFQIEDMPDSDLPFAFDKDSLKTEYDRFTPLVESTKDVKDAIDTEEKTMRELNSEFTGLAKQLGLNLDGVFRNHHYFRHRIIQYAQASAQGVRRTSPVGNVEAQSFADAAMHGIIGRSWLKKRKGSKLDFLTDYLQANAEVRIQMRQDIETMKTLQWLKNKFDIAPKLREKIR